MTRRVGPWTVLEERVVYDNPWISVVDHRVRHPGGVDGQYGVVRFKNRAIGVLALDQNGAAPLVGQHRFPHDAYSWELPEGGGPMSVDPLEAAKRELREETGFTAARWHQFAAFDTSNSVTDECAVCFLAWDLRAGDASPEPSEEFAYDRVSFSALYERVLAGHIRDSLTIIMTLKAAALAAAGQLPEQAVRLIRGDV